MKGLIMKDLYVISKQLKFFFVAMLVMVLIMDAEIGVFMLFITSSLPITSVAYDEMSGWNKYANTLPVSRFELVFSKFAIGYIGVVLGIILVLVGQIFRSLTGNTDILNMQFMIIIISIGLICIAINTGAVIIFGSEKGRYIFILSFAFIGGLLSLLNSLVDFDISRINFSFSWVMVFVAVAANILSIMASFKYGKKV